MPRQLSDIISTEEYFRHMCVAFPDLCEKIESESGDHSKMERFADYTIENIKTNNIPEITKCFDFQEERISICPAILDAMVVSYCESLLLGDVASEIHKYTSYMKPRLFKMYNDYRIHYFDLVEKSNRKK